MAIPVMRYKRKKNLNDPLSPECYYLQRVPGHTRTYTLEDVAREIETIGALSIEDVVHVMQAFVRRLRIVVTKGDKVKIDGLGTFHITFNCNGTDEEKECTVRSIRKVNLRFAVDNTLRLVNDAITTTRRGENNVQFAIKSDVSLGDEDGNGGGTVDPDA